VSPNQGWVCGRNGTILHTTDGGQTWEQQVSGVDTTLFDIDFADSLRGMIAGNSVVLFTTDGGHTWQRTLSGVAEERNQEIESRGNPRILAASNPASPVVFYVTGCRGTFAISVFDAAGCLVRIIPGNRTGGLTAVVWDGRDQNGQPVGPGLYLARVTDPPGSATVKFTYLGLRR